MQTQTSNTLHNAIMEAGSKDRPPMLAPGNYIQWKSRIKRYIDTKPNRELIHFCLTNPPYELGWKDKFVLGAEGNPTIATQQVFETYQNVKQEIRDQLNAEAKAVQIILTGIDKDIYSAVDACPNACEMWKAIERLKQGESINVKDLETNLVWECQKPKRAKDAAYHREKMLLCKQEEAGIQLNAEQADWKDDTNDESDDQELEAHYMYMAKLQQVSPDAVDSGPIFDKEPEQKVQNDDHYDVFAIEYQHPEQSESAHNTYLLEQDVQNMSIESVDMNYDSEQIDQNDEDVDLAKERELLASLIAKLKCEIDESKNRNTLLETSNKVLVEKLKSEIADFKNKNKSLTEAKNKLSEVNDHLFADLMKSKAKLKRRNSIEYATEMKLECAKVRGDLLSYKMEYERYHNKYTKTINDLNQTVSELKEKLSAHQDTISILKQQKDAQIKLYKIQEDKDVEKVIDLENKVKVLDNIVYKTGQSVQTMNMLNNKCRTSFAKPEYLKKAKQANPRLYDIGCYNDNLALMLSPESDEVIRLEKESRSKLSDLAIPFDYAKLNSLYDLFVPQREKSSKQRFFSELSRIKLKRRDSIEYASEMELECAKVKEANNKLSEVNAHLYADYKKSKDELKRRNTVEYATEMELECAKVRGDLLSNKIEYKRSSEKYTHIINDLNQTVSELKEKLSAHQYTISILKQQKDAQIKLYKTQEDKEIEKVIDLENKVKVLDNIVYKTGQSVQTMNMLNNKCRTSFAKLEYLKKAKQANPRLYDICCYNDNLSLMLSPESNVDLKARLQDKGIVISELKKLIKKLKGKSVDTKFEKSSVIRQPNAFKSQRPSVLGKTTTFSNSFIRKDFSKSTSVTQNNVSNDFSKPVTAQTLPMNKKSCFKNTNVLAPGMYKIHIDHTQARTSKLPQDSKKTNKHVSFSIGVIPTTSVSRPQLKSNPQGDRVLCSNSRGKKLEVEEHRRNVKLSKNKMSVTACNDTLNAKTLNVKFVSAMCDKSVMIDKHDMCVLKSVAKPLKKTTVSESNKKPRNNVRKLYEHVSKTCSWWYPKFTPSRYIWKPKFGTEHVIPNLIEIVLFIVDSGCSKHMMGNLKLLINFMEKFLGTIKFGNDQIAPILGYGDLVQGAVTIKRVYYVEGLNHNLFFVGQLCDADLEVAFRKSTCFIRDLNGNDLLKGSRGTDLYSITLQSTNSLNPFCLMAKATSSQAWLWHRRLSHLNFDTINLLSKKDIMVGLPKLKFIKDYLCSSCELRKAKRKSFHS
nr:retrovirus-related Pol polyprotein from transposon TNT 1-94 [Tanacetum cinerariifolium]